jgi:hypothetical protein
MTNEDFITDTDELIAAAVDPALIRESLDLNAIQALVDAATPGPWKSWRKIPGVARIETVTGDALIYRDSLDEDDGQLITEDDADFIAQARTLVPELIAELREARATIARVKDVVESDLHGTYWGEVQIPQPQLRKALGGL